MGATGRGMSTYIGRHWRGENSLAYAFWVNCILGNIAIRVIAYVLSDLVVPAMSQDDVSQLEGLFYAAQIAFIAWALVGVWRSAEHVIAVARHTQPPRFAFWAHAARVWVILNVVFVVLASLFVISSL